MDTAMLTLMFNKQKLQIEKGAGYKRSLDSKIQIRQGGSKKWHKLSPKTTKVKHCHYYYYNYYTTNTIATTTTSIGNTTMANGNKVKISGNVKGEVKLIKAHYVHAGWQYYYW
jgi:hypothetical protein